MLLKMASFEGKTVIVTGSSSGIGRETVLLLGKRGANVVVHGQRKEKLEETVSALKSEGVPESRILVVTGPIQKEKTQDALINETLAKFGQVDVLINNAAVSHNSTDPDRNSITNLDFIYQVNVRSVYRLNELALPHLAKTKGNIVNISSVGGQRGQAVLVPYAMTKAALDHYTRSAAINFAEQGVRMNVVSPGPIQTDFLARHEAPELKEAVNEIFVKYGSMVPLKRPGAPSEVASLIAFVSSSEASYITGSILVVDGGYLCGQQISLDP
ncbi:unnamed protein product [Bursaphelenchus okinawaensis]|uniref:Uncharacterized protein n=1 Tax=Bursaphelenchus okinawaensis TaxID=465554 RepID=A0A811L4C3_9BILA|nr:unnamed protein product [Bursaphelenchus okinawaensis]CAG9119333.1 unnamed protein product [Bursaphelenchus okinawaensis]